MREKRSIIWKMQIEDLRNLVANSTSFAEVLREFGFTHKGGNYLTLKKRLELENIDYSHFKKTRPFPGVINKPLEEILVKDSTYGRSSLKRRLLKEKILINVCSMCGQKPEWKGTTLVMILDHINGISNDNRLENLRLVCPNCNSQLPTFAGRKMKINRTCSKCDNSISRNTKTGLCRSCYHKSTRRVERPNNNDLISLVDKKGLRGVGRMYGVSAPTIKRWLSSC